MTIYIHRCMIVPADLAPLARQLAEELAGPPGSGMFVTGLSPTGQEPVTHYISSGMIEDVFADLLIDPLSLHNEIGEIVPLSLCEDLLNRSDISDDDPNYAMTRLGLKIIQNDNA